MDDSCGWQPFRRRSVAPETMSRADFCKFIHRKLIRDGWSVARARWVDLELACETGTIAVVLGSNYFDRRSCPVPRVLSNGIEKLKTQLHPRTLIVLVVHDEEMIGAFELEARNLCSYVHWTQLNYLLPLQTSRAAQRPWTPEEIAWADGAIIKNAVFCRQRAVCELRAGDLQSALTWAQRSIEPDYCNPVGHNFVTQIYLQTGDLDKAEEAARHAINCAEPNSVSLLRMSQVQFRRRNLPAALEWAHKCTAFDPWDPWAQSHLADVCAAAGSHEAAQKAAERAVKISPDVPYFVKRLYRIRETSHGHSVQGMNSDPGSDARFQ